MTTLSSAWLMTYASCSGNSRMLSVCSTAPMARDREVRLEVLLRVPAERADAVAGRARRASRARRRAGPRCRRPRRTSRGAAPSSVHVTHSLSAYTRLAVAQDRGDREREVLHRARGHGRSVDAGPAWRVTAPNSPAEDGADDQPSTNRPPARRVTRNDSAANHSGHTGFGIGETSGFGCEYAFHVRTHDRQRQRTRAATRPAAPARSRARRSTT